MNERYLFTRAYSYDSGVTASTPGTSVGANTPGKAVDEDRDTFWETADSTPQLKIDLGAAQAIDSLWFYSDNVLNYQLFYSTDDVSYLAADAIRAGDANGFNLAVGFVERNVRYWRLDITDEVVVGNNTKIFEVMLMKEEITFSDGDGISYIEEMIEDRGGGAFELADGSYVSFEGMSNEKKEGYRVGFEMIEKSRRDELLSLWVGPPKRPVLTVALFPDDFPDRVYQVVFDEVSFGFRYSTLFTGAGYSGEISLRQR